MLVNRENRAQKPHHRSEYPRRMFFGPFTVFYAYDVEYPFWVLHNAHRTHAHWNCFSNQQPFIPISAWGNRVGSDSLRPNKSLSHPFGGWKITLSKMRREFHSISSFVDGKIHSVSIWWYERPLMWTQYFSCQPASARHFEINMRSTIHGHYYDYSFYNPNVLSTWNICGWCVRVARHSIRSFGVRISSQSGSLAFVVVRCFCVIVTAAAVTVAATAAS